MSSHLDFGSERMEILQPTPHERFVGSLGLQEVQLCSEQQ